MFRTLFVIMLFIGLFCVSPVLGVLALIIVLCMGRKK